MKKIILIIALLCLGIGGYFMFTNKDKENITNKNILVVYYSASGSTKRVAQIIKDNLNADIYELVPKEKYTPEDLDWTNSSSRVNKEHDDESLRNIKLESTQIENWSTYDTILIGYPIWWGIAAWPVDTFVKENDFTNKTVIPFCTSASSSLGNSAELLKNMSNGGNWLEGHRFSSNATEAEIKNWTNNVK